MPRKHVVVQDPAARPILVGGAAFAPGGQPLREPRASGRGREPSAVASRPSRDRRTGASGRAELAQFLVEPGAAGRAVECARCSASRSAPRCTTSSTRVDAAAPRSAAVATSRCASGPSAGRRRAAGARARCSRSVRAAGKRGRDLRVEHGRARAEDRPQHFEILTRGVQDLRSAASCRSAASDVERQPAERIDAQASCRRCQLQQAQLRAIGALAHEFGVERDARARRRGVRERSSSAGRCRQWCRRSCRIASCHCTESAFERESPNRLHRPHHRTVRRHRPVPPGPGRPAGIAAAAHASTIAANVLARAAVQRRCCRCPAVGAPGMHRCWCIDMAADAALVLGCCCAWPASRSGSCRPRPRCSASSWCWRRCCVLSRLRAVATDRDRAQTPPWLVPARWRCWECGCWWCAARILRAATQWPMCACVALSSLAQAADRPAADLPALFPEVAQAASSPPSDGSANARPHPRHLRHVHGRHRGHRARGRPPRDRLGPATSIRR